VAVDLAAAGEEHEGPLAAVEGGPQHVAGAADVDRAAEERIALAPDDAGDRGEMDDAGTAGHRLGEALAVAGVVDAAPRGGREVEATGVVAAKREGRAQGGSDETGAAGDEDGRGHLASLRCFARSGIVYRPVVPVLAPDRPGGDRRNRATVAGAPPQTSSNRRKSRKSGDPVIAVDFDAPWALPGRRRSAPAPAPDGKSKPAALSPPGRNCRSADGRTTSGCRLLRRASPRPPRCPPGLSGWKAQSSS
jgi:hypothetical protein